jgi:hypothetical protein
MVSMSLESVKERNRQWLASRGLLARPWLVLGSAPNPSIPTDLAKRAELVCINNAGATAARLGLPPASLTVRNSNKEWNSVAGCTMPLVLWMSNANPVEVYWTKLFKAKAHVGEIRAMNKAVRAEITDDILGSGVAEVGRMHKPSTGIFAALYGLFTGAPAIILAGLSMEGDGYSYGTLAGIQHHRDEDLFAMRILAARYPSVSTTERDVSERTGIPMFELSRKVG